MFGMKLFFFFVVVAIVGGKGVQWESLNNFKDVLNQYQNSAEKVILFIQDYLKNITSDTQYFTKKLDESSLVRQLSILVNGKCSSIINYPQMKSSFMLHASRLEVPFLKILTEIKDELWEISSTVKMYQELADTKFWNCRMSEDNCTDVTENWLRERLSEVYCRMNSNCLSQAVRRKRGVSSLLLECFGKVNCKNGRCVEKSQICNGYNDCGDNTDEEGCQGTGSANCSLSFGTYLCNNNQCVALSTVCNEVDDCGDGSDEGTNCTNSCPHDCHPTGACFRSPRGPTCLTSCPYGTFETLAGCSQTMQPKSSSISQLIENVPRLVSRHSAALRYLKTRTIAEIDKSVSSLANCRSAEFYLLGKITKFEEPGTRQNIGFSNNTTTIPG